MSGGDGDRIMTWASLKKLGWACRTGHGLYDFVYVRPNGDSSRSGVEGRDFFASTQDAVHWAQRWGVALGESTSTADDEKEAERDGNGKEETGLNKSNHHHNSKLMHD